jgi:PAS domain S-box-containing protein
VFGRASQATHIGYISSLSIAHFEALSSRAHDRKFAFGGGGCWDARNPERFEYGASYLVNRFSDAANGVHTVAPRPVTACVPMTFDGETRASPCDAADERSVLDAVSDVAIFALGSNGCVTNWNSGATSLLGYERAEALGMPVTAFLAYLADEPAQHISQQSACDLSAFEGDGCCVHKDGSRLRTSIRLYPLFPGGFAGLIRRHDEPSARLLESEARSRQLIDGIVAYGIHMLDPDGRVSSWSTGAHCVADYEPDEIIGRHFSCLYTEEDCTSGEPDNALTAAANLGRYEREGWHLRKDGSRFWASVVIDAVRAEGGELVGFANVMRDITDRMRTQTELEQKRSAIAKSQRMKAIGQLTGGIAHDFNNLLTIITNSLDVIAQAPEDSARNQRVIENARNAVEHGVRLTNHLLAFARSQPLRPKPETINSLISGFASVLQGAAGSAIALKVELAPSLDRISVDATQFKAALLNLVVNAREAMHGEQEAEMIISTGLVDVEEINVSPRLAPGLYAGVTVSDSGCGIASEALDHVFEPFFTSKEVGEGSGLGLSQVYGFAAHSGGGVGIVTSVGNGTSVTIYLPMATPAAELADGGDSAYVPRKILLVEDDENVRVSTQEAVELLGYSVIAESNGPDALARLHRENDIEILFTDVVMPHGMSGVTLAREARARRPDLRILLASGHPRDAFVSGDDLDEFAFLAKPYRLQELAAVLKALKPAGGAAGERHFG